MEAYLSPAQQFDRELSYFLRHSAGLAGKFGHLDDCLTTGRLNFWIPPSQAMILSLWHVVLSCILALQYRLCLEFIGAASSIMRTIAPYRPFHRKATQYRVHVRSGCFMY